MAAPSSGSNTHSKVYTATQLELDSADSMTIESGPSLRRQTTFTWTWAITFELEQWTAGLNVEALPRERIAAPVY